MGQKKLPLTDGDTYLRLCEPFENAEVAHDAVSAFFNELYDLRVKHRIKDMHVIIDVAYRHEDGTYANGYSSLHAGDENLAESMCAFALGSAAKRRQENTDRLIASATTTTE